MTGQDPGTRPTDSEEPADNADQPPLVQSEVLLQGRKQILILHDGEVYKLFRTRNNKLLLQK